MDYLQNMPQSLSKYGFCKTLAVRREIIHIKHIFTEAFVRRSFIIEWYLNTIGMNLIDYMEYMTNRIRLIHHISREYVSDINKVLKDDRDKFFPMIELFIGLKNVIILDFDGVLTSKRFKDLYLLCIKRCKVLVCTANPTVNNSWFEKRSLPAPGFIHAVHGKKKKIRTIIEISKRYDNVFYVDNEREYLEYAWIFGIKTFLYKSGKIKYFSMKSK